MGNKFKANTVVAIKLARAVFFMLRNKTVFDPDRLVAALAKTDLALAAVYPTPNLDPTKRQCPYQSQTNTSWRLSASGRVGRCQESGRDEWELL
jgi:hypothetical protein